MCFLTPLCYVNKAITREIRKIEKSQSLEDGAYIVAMTANVLEDDRRACVNAGMNDFISKPVQITELQNVISKSQGETSLEKSEFIASPLSSEALQEILPMYLSQAREQVNAIEEAAKSGNTEKIMRIAHQLKGSSANLGASALARLCGQIENDGADGASEMDSSLVADLGRQLDIAESLLRQAIR